jgi:hypothetical protein
LLWLRLRLGGLRWVCWRGLGRLLGLGCGLGWVLLGFVGFIGFLGLRIFVVGVQFDRLADGFAPAIGVEGVDVFVLGEVDSLHEGLAHVSDSAAELGFYVAADDGGDEAREGGAEIASGEVVAGEEVGEVFGEFFRGLDAGLLLGVVEAEMRMAAGARSAATAAIGEREQTQRYAVLWT